MATTSSRESDQNGFLLIRGCPLSREGVYEYAAKQVYPAGHPQMGDPNRIIGVYRPDSAIREQAAIDSFKSIPFINEHEMLAGSQETAKHPNDVAPEEKGIDGVLTDNVWYDENDGWLKGDVKAFSRKAQQDIEDGKDNLSLGFSCLFKLEEGSFKGKDYEVIQYHLRGNHLASVDEARVEGARILDARCFDSANLSLTVKTNEETVMATKTKAKSAKVVKGRVGDSALDQLKAMVPALQQIIDAGEKGQLDCSGDAQDADDQNDAVENAESEENSDADQTYHDDEDATKDADGTDDDEDGADRDVDASNAVVEQAKGLLAQIQSLLTNDQATDEADESPSDDSDDVDGAGMDEDEMKKERQTMDMNADALEAKVGDSAIKRVYADQAKKAKLYDRLSNVIGAFDGAAMDSKSMAKYGLKRLGVKAIAGHEDMVLDAYLNGMASQQKAAATTIESRAADSKLENAQLDQYLAEGAK